MTAVEAELVRVEPPDADHVATVELGGGPTSYLDIHVLRQLLSALKALDAASDCRAIVVCSEGKHFCAGRNFAVERTPDDTSAAVYGTAVELFDIETPWGVELTGGSIGAGMGLALCADFRVAAPSAYLSGNFVTLGLHHGFGLTATLPRVVGPHRAADLLMSGRRVGADEALRMGLVDEVDEDVAAAARRRAASLAALPPLAVQEIRRTLRTGFRDAFKAAVESELPVQQMLSTTDDVREASAALRERRAGVFVGQ